MGGRPNDSGGTGGRKDNKQPTPPPKYLSFPAPRKTSFTSSHKREGESSRACDPRTASSNHASASIGNCPVVPPTSKVTVVIAPQPTLVVDLEHSSKTAHATAVVPSIEKKRKTKEGEKSSSKRSRREGSESRPIPDGVFDPEFHVGSHANFHLSSTQPAIVEQMSEGDLINVALELTTRGAMLDNA
ncbi:hypothetical protein VIGAN_07177700 [Vigna angularis var. angularis]|uniref:Uncharacterized protein n=1 Tax=Vigna angularis var. angularis TaxID=157739 RepID=A0A0S3SJD8_PHAAN|nr:hypothetical protein VIGAN_07177700 [Vigna angularis var. angularis]